MRRQYLRMKLYTARYVEKEIKLPNLSLREVIIIIASHYKFSFDNSSLKFKGDKLLECDDQLIASGRNLPHRIEHPHLSPLREVRCSSAKYLTKVIAKTEWYNNNSVNAHASPVSNSNKK